MYNSPGQGRGRARVPGQYTNPRAAHQENMGYGRHGQQPHDMDEQAGNPEVPDPGAAGQSLQDRTQQRDAYSVTRPKEEKRRAIAEQARKGEEMLRQHKESTRVKHVSYVGTVGGGQVGQTAAREQQQHEVRNAQFNSRQRAQQYRAKEKEKEDAEHNKKKMEQRKKAEDNERLADRRQNSLQQQHESGKQAWLDRLERQTKEAKAKKILSTTAGRSYCPEPEILDDDDDEDDEDDETDQNLAGFQGDGAASYSPDGATGASRYPGGANSNPSHLVYDERTPLDKLVSIYPNFDPDVLNSILMDCNGNVLEAKKLLSLNQ